LFSDVYAEAGSADALQRARGCEMALYSHGGMVLDQAVLEHSQQPGRYKK
jgi:hypothetical protein